MAPKASRRNSRTLKFVELYLASFSDITYKSTSIQSLSVTLNVCP